MNTEFSKKFFELRKEHNFSQEELAEKLGVSRQAISKWERGESSPDTENLVALAKLYRISLDDMLNINVRTVLAKEEPKHKSINLKKSISEEYVSHPADTPIREVTPIHTSDKEIYPKFDNSAAQSASSVGNVPIREASPVGSAASEAFPQSAPKTAEKKQMNNKPFDSAKYTEPVMPVINPVVNSNFKMKSSPKNPKEFFDEAEGKCKSAGGYKALYAFPYPLIVLIAFFITGGLLNWWWINWLMFLTIPLYYTTIAAIQKRNMNAFCYPVLVTLAYLTIGMIFGVWHPTWLLFLTIPLYYYAVNLFINKAIK